MKKNSLRTRHGGRWLRPWAEFLEDRTAPAVNFHQFADAVVANLAPVQAALTAALKPASQIPFLDSQLDDLAETNQFVSDLAAQIHDALDPLTSANEIEDALNAAFGSRLVEVTVTGGRVDDMVTIDITFHDSVNLANTSLTFGLGLPGVPLRVEEQGGIGLDLILDYRLRFTYTQVDANTNDLTLAAAKLPSGHELTIAVDAHLTEDFDIEASLGFLEVTMTNAGGEATALNATVALDGLTNNQPKFDVVGAANLNFAVDAGFDANFPSIGADLVGSWSFDFDSTNPTGGAAPDLSLNGVRVTLGTVISDMLRPIMDVIGPMQEVLHPLFEVLRVPLPVVSDLAELIGIGDVTIEDLAEIAAGSGLLPAGYKELVEIILLVEDLEDLVSKLGENPEAQSLAIYFDEPDDPTDNFKLQDLAGMDLRDLNPVNMDNAKNPLVPTLQPEFDFGSFSNGIDYTEIAEQINAALPDNEFTQKLDKVLTKFAKMAENGITYTFPLLDNPAMGVVSILLGNDVDLFNFKFQIFMIGELPDELLDAVALPFGLNVKLSGAFVVDIYLEAGYDTRGIRDLLSSGDPADLLNGFYIRSGFNPDTNSHLAVSGFIAATAAGGAGFFSFGVEGKIEADIELKLDPAADDNLDGRLRLYSELDECFLETSGSLSASLYAFAEIGVEILGEFIGYREEFEIASATLINFHFGCIGNPYEPPVPVQLADATQFLDPNDPDKDTFVVTNPDGILTLNMGPLFAQRNVENAADGLEVFIITPGELPIGVDPNSVPPGEVIRVTAFGYSETYIGVKKVVANGGEDSDTITVHEDVGVNVELGGGPGNDSLIYHGSGTAILRGDAGNDSLIGGQGLNQLYGGDGAGTLLPGEDNDLLTGGPAGNLMFGEHGDDVLTGGAGFNAMKGGNGDDRLLAGPLDDILDGEGGDDELVAGAGNASLFGGRGDDRLTWKAGDGVVKFYGGEGRDAAAFVATDGIDTFTLDKLVDPDFDVKIAVDLSDAAAVDLPLSSIEEISIAGRGEADDVTVNELTQTSVLDIGINLGDVLANDGKVDHVVVNGTEDADVMTVQTEGALLKIAGHLFGGVERVSGLPNYVIHSANMADDVKIHALGDADQINVLSIPGPTMVLGNGGNDTFNVFTSAPAGMDPLLNKYPTALEVRADAGVDKISVALTGQTPSDLAILEEDVITADWTVLVDNFPQPVQHVINYQEMGGTFGGGVNLTTTDADDKVRIHTTLAGALTTVKTQDGHDQIIVESSAQVNATLAGILGALAIDAGAGNNLLKLRDPGATVGNTAVLVTSSIIAGMAGPGDATAIQYLATGGAFANLTLEGSNNAALAEGYHFENPGAPIRLDANAGADVATVRNVSKPAILNMGAGDDHVFVGDVANTLNGILAEVTVDGEGGVDRLVTHDEGSAQGKTYNLNVSTLLINGTPINYQSVETMQLGAPPSSDSFHIIGVAAGTQVKIEAGNGPNTDTLIGPNVANTWNVTGQNLGQLNGMVTFIGIDNLVGGNLDDHFLFANGAGVSGIISGEVGTDTLDYAAYTKEVRVHLGAGTATGVQLGISTVEAVVGGSSDDILIGNALMNFLWGNGGNDILLGEGSSDFIDGGSGRDLVFGGAGKDILIGGAGDDVVVNGTTAHDAKLNNLIALRKEWTRKDAPYKKRIANLRNGGGKNGNVKLNKNTVFNDQAADVLFGSGALDWFWRHKGDSLPDKVASESVN